MVKAVWWCAVGASSMKCGGQHAIGWNQVLVRAALGWWHRDRDYDWDGGMGRAHHTQTRWIRRSGLAIAGHKLEESRIERGKTSMSTACQGCPRSRGLLEDREIVSIRVGTGQMDAFVREPASSAFELVIDPSWSWRGLIPVGARATY